MLLCAKEAIPQKHILHNSIYAKSKSRESLSMVTEIREEVAAVRGTVGKGQKIHFWNDKFCVLIWVVVTQFIHLSQLIKLYL